MIRMKNPSHPGRILREEFMKPLDLSAYKLAGILSVTRPRLNDLVREKRSITADMALRLAKHFRTTPEFWMNLQQNHDLAASEATTDLSSIPEMDPVG